MATISTEKTRLVYGDQLHKTLEAKERSLELKACCLRISTCIGCLLLMPCCSCTLTALRSRRDPEIVVPFSKTWFCCALCFNSLDGRCCEPTEYYLDEEDLFSYGEMKNNSEVVSALSKSSLQQTVRPARLNGDAFDCVESPSAQKMDEYVITEVPLYA